MVRRVLWLCALCACTQDFDSFNPADGAAVADVSTDGPGGADTGVDAGVQDATKDVTVQDVAPDVPVVDAPPDAPPPCTETGAIMFGGHCYFLVTTAQTQSVAAAFCASTSAHLVTITTSAEQAAVIALGSGTERWTDLYRNGGPAKDVNYKWLTGEGRNNFNAWSPGEPNGTGQCGSLLGTGLWNDQDCTISLASICERE